MSIVKKLRMASAFVLAIVVMFTGLPVIAKEKPVYTGFFSSLAVSGYDTVSYFTDGKAVKGSSSFETQWNGATWRFVSAEHRDMFLKSPEKYAPQYGGYCAWAVAHDDTASSDPEVWKIIDGKLYLNYDKDKGVVWAAEAPKFIADADKNWPKVLDK